MKILLWLNSNYEAMAMAIKQKNHHRKYATPCMENFSNEYFYGLGC